MTVRLSFAALFALAIAACGGNNSENTPTVATADAPASAPETADLAAEARRIAHEAIIIDTHIDVPYRLDEKWEDVSKATEDGNFDYPRAVEGGLNAPFMSIYTPAELEATGGSKDLAESLIDLVEKIVASAPDKFALATSPDDIEKQFAAGLISLPMGMENGSPIEGDLANLKHFYDRGIRYITLAHALSNHIADSSYDDNKHWGGLSPFGEKVVREMNRLGIMVDVSHISDGAFWDVMELTDVPAIASHSSARHFTAGFERNMDDDMIKRLADEGGVIMISFGSDFISEETRKASEVRKTAYDAWLKDQGKEDDEALRKEFSDQHSADYPYRYATLDEVLDHFDYVVKLTGGTDHVGIGSDFDGVGDSLPIGLKDVSMYPNLIEGLLKRGYSEADIRKILGGNLLRVWRAIDAAAEQPKDHA